MEAGPVSGAVVGRFAPSPSGRLHLGNLACSLLAWLSAKSQGGRIVLRIEDLDAERCPRIYADLLEQDLAWLGLVWDEGGSTGGPHGPYYQSECADIYTGQYKKLEAQGLVYPCFCSRAQLHAASAPHTSDGNVIYPGTCRDLTAAQIAEKRKKKAPAAGVDIAGGIGVKNTLWRLNAFFEGNFDCRIANSEAGGFEIELRGGMTGGT